MNKMNEWTIILTAMYAVPVIWRWDGLSMHERIWEMLQTYCWNQIYILANWEQYKAYIFQLWYINTLQSLNKINEWIITYHRYF